MHHYSHQAVCTAAVLYDVPDPFGLVLSDVLTYLIRLALYCRTSWRTWSVWPRAVGIHDVPDPFGLVLSQFMAYLIRLALYCRMSWRTWSVWPCTVGCPDVPDPFGLVLSDVLTYLIRLALYCRMSWRTWFVWPCTVGFRCLAFSTWRLPGAFSTGHRLLDGHVMNRMVITFCSYG